MPRRKTIRAFDAIYNEDGTCTDWECGEDGVVLAYDSFSPEVAHWFCAYHWTEYEEIFTVVEDHRKKKV